MNQPPVTPVTVVHLMRHGEVHNPEGVLYGRLPGYQLSALGRSMAETVARFLAGHDVTHVVASPLERAQETAAPIAAAHDLPVETDDRLIEAGNVFEGKTFGVGDGALTKPAVWRHLVNPFTPSWGEPYEEIAARMLGAIADARAAAEGHEAVLVSHQLPVWTVRSKLEGRRLWHDPRKRECSLASLTSLTYAGDHLTSIAYSEPAAALLAGAAKRAGA
jgi:broad specificity phosphatase PhoE